jgi:hypothetical protein
MLWRPSSNSDTTIHSACGFIHRTFEGSKFLSHKVIKPILFHGLTSGNDMDMVHYQENAYSCMNYCRCTKKGARRC